MFFTYFVYMFSTWRSDPISKWFSARCRADSAVYEFIQNHHMIFGAHIVWLFFSKQDDLYISETHGLAALDDELYAHQFSWSYLMIIHVNQLKFLQHKCENIIIMMISAMMNIMGSEHILDHSIPGDVGCLREWEWYRWNGKNLYFHPICDWSMWVLWFVPKTQLHPYHLLHILHFDDIFMKNYVGFVLGVPLHKIFVTRVWHHRWEMRRYAYSLTYSKLLTFVFV